MDSNSPSRSRSQRFLLALAGVALLFAGFPLAAQQPGSPGKVKFRGASFPVAEDAGAVDVIVRRLQGSTGEVSVELSTTPGSATEGEDYEPVVETLVWEDGDRSDRVVSIPILDDDENEGQETFGVILENPTGGVEISPPSTAVVRIKPSDRPDDDGDDDDDGDEEEAGILKLTEATFTAFESAGEAIFTVERDDGDAGEVTVDYMTVDGSAEEPDDYLLTAGTLTWGDGEDGEQDVSVPLIDDDVEEGLETITVILTNATGGASLGVRDSASIAIVDDDAADGSCIPGPETGCLGNGRFQVTGTWETEDGADGPFMFLPGSDEVVQVWFFDPGNIELLVKLLDGCGLNDHFWVFYSGLTNVGYEMEVLDLETGATQVYSNEVGSIPDIVLDTEALPCD